MSDQRREPDPPRARAYELEAVVAPPDLPGEVIACADACDAIDRLAADLVVHAENCVRVRNWYPPETCWSTMPRSL